MPDITLCSPTKYLDKCGTCYRRNAYPSERQSYSNFYNYCVKKNYKYYIEDITQCPNCFCMTKTINKKCCKCKKVKR